jgi:hypothetical protein
VPEAETLGASNDITALLPLAPYCIPYPLRLPPPSRPTMTSGTERLPLPRTLHLSSSPLRDTTFAGAYLFFYLPVALIHVDVQMAEAVRNMYFYPLRTPHKPRAASPMGPTCCSPFIMRSRRSMTRSWPRTGGRMRKASCS